MITLPTPVIRLGHKAGNWLIKNGPKIMSVAGGAMAIGGAVMACNATLKVDTVLDAHKSQMEHLNEAKNLLESGEAEGELTMHDIKQAKFETYARTVGGLLKLYGPAFAVGMSGVGLMQGAFIVTERRRSTAVAALTSLNTAYQDYRSRVAERFGEEALELDAPTTEKHLVKSAASEERAEQDCIYLDDADADAFTFIFGPGNENWANGNAFLLNERFLTATIDAFNYRLSSHIIDHVFMNDILKAWSMNETELGCFHGWNGINGDIIDYSIQPYLMCYENDDDKQFPMLVPTDMNTLRELEANDIQEGYCIGITLKSSSDEHDDVISPRFIYNEVFGG